MEIYNGVMPMEIDTEDYTINNSGLLYIVKLREHILTKENIYKIGRTKNIFQRINGYPKGTQLLFCINTEDIIKKETDLIQWLYQYNRKDLGKEYFQINLQKLINLIINNIEITDCYDLVKNTPTEKKSNKRKLEDPTDIFGNITRWIYKDFYITKDISDKISSTNLLQSCKSYGINISSKELEENMKYLGITIQKEGNRKFYTGLKYNMNDL
jgi:hypothetical protein